MLYVHIWFSLVASLPALIFNEDGKLKDFQVNNVNVILFLKKEKAKMILRNAYLLSSVHLNFLCNTDFSVATNLLCRVTLFEKYTFL